MPFGRRREGVDGENAYGKAAEVVPELHGRKRVSHAVCRVKAGVCRPSSAHHMRIWVVPRIRMIRPVAVFCCGFFIFSET